MRGTKSWARFEDRANLVLGACLFAVPLLFGRTEEAAGWINVLAGAWLVGSPFALGFADTRRRCGTPSSWAYW